MIASHGIGRRIHWRSSNGTLRGSVDHRCHTYHSDFGDSPAIDRFREMGLAGQN